MNRRKRIDLNDYRETKELFNVLCSFIEHHDNMIMGYNVYDSDEVIESKEFNNLCSLLTLYVDKSHLDYDTCYGTTYYHFYVEDFNEEICRLITYQDKGDEFVYDLQTLDESIFKQEFFDKIIGSFKKVLEQYFDVLEYCNHEWEEYKW